MKTIVLVILTIMGTGEDGTITTMQVVPVESETTYRTLEECAVAGDAFEGDAAVMGWLCVDKSTQRRKRDTSI